MCLFRAHPKTAFHQTLSYRRFELTIFLLSRQNVMCTCGFVPQSDWYRQSKAVDFSHGCYQALSSSPFFRREPGNEAILCPSLCPDVCSCACGLSGVDTLSQSLAVSSRTGIECVDLITGQNAPQPLLYLSHYCTSAITVPQPRSTVTVPHPQHIR